MADGGGLGAPVLTADAIATAVGKSRSYIYARLKLLDLCQEAKQALREGMLDASRASLDPCWRMPLDDEYERELLDKFANVSRAVVVASLAAAHAARAAGAWCHVGRVNTKRRIVACGVAGVTSFDGTSVTQFPSTLALLQGAVAVARRQGAMLLDAADPSPWKAGGQT